MVHKTHIMHTYSVPVTSDIEEMLFGQTIYNICEAAKCR